MRVYIAGPMSGIPGFNRSEFHSAATLLSGDGHVVLNPAILPDGLEQREYMDICCAMIRCADGVYMLDGWENSAGARAENALAEKLGMVVMYQGDQFS
ncbi:DUF4406 domain-containing protein [Shimwellia blattae]|uniref:Phage protein n=1 Tax=Shimwellia blattae (strain ATCC 29907 / DSM 4481 / JCM 1650 / NBRC 105725 / CDC 9005-74) TaxID=630626 RepID=I2B9U8_SHIBC|nr:DUF4406 domain-containing protein [Shimwellia blattae]AFJ47302.1 hypothetical protein EBL_c22110 [Shimwellia blattae DSM 4481 = NBRC 105725]GAB80502.1 hypothetical protein EB105725_05_02300 [Shimwellia blattae DSM 4481 = NBRC 105725]VDY64796.1 Uncharacterised protein [Shimwellia blattae]VEC22895.1 Uncharacterised protein [Shimwellia blattae]